MHVGHVTIFNRILCNRYPIFSPFRYVVSRRSHKVSILQTQPVRSSDQIPQNSLLVGIILSRDCLLAQSNSAQTLIRGFWHIISSIDLIPAGTLVNVD